MQRRNVLLSTGLGLVMVLGSSFAQAQYQLTNLVSNQTGAARHDDPLLVNGWGLVYGPGGPFWISDNGSGWATLYTSTGAAKTLQVEIPSASGAGPGSPTGIVFNGSPEFQVKQHPALFLFATLDGTISGWAPQSDPNNAIIKVDNSKSGAVYTGLAITSKASGNFLFAADNANNKVDVYNGKFKLVTSFTDPAIPAGFAPFGVQDINGLVYVAYGSTTEGPGGFIDVLSEEGTLVKQLTHARQLNQPWGLAAAPSNFGPLSNSLLISNNTNGGAINAFNITTGEFVGTVKDTDGKPIHINQLWGIEFGGGTSNNGGKNQLFFTAGPNNNLAGTFGVISFK